MAKRLLIYSLVIKRIRTSGSHPNPNIIVKKGNEANRRKTINISVHVKIKVCLN